MEAYKKLKSYILATVIFDLTVEFCDVFFSRNRISRTIDQTCPQCYAKRCRRVIQAGRSGKQNIAEGYTFKSTESYIKLLGVAKGSFKELSADYEDFLRQRKLSIWSKDHYKVRAFRDFRASWKDPECTIPNTPNLPNNPEDAANMLLTFCQMETYLLEKQIKALEEKFLKEGGYREKLFKKRLEYRDSKNN